MNKVYALLKEVPKGKVTTYGILAKAAGVHHRQVAALLKRNFDPSIPCHRVVMSNGKIGGYNRGVKEKIRKLREEGVEIEKGKIKDFKKVLFRF